MNEKKRNYIHINTKLKIYSLPVELVDFFIFDIVAKRRIQKRKLNEFTKLKVEVLPHILIWKVGSQQKTESMIKRSDHQYT